MCCGTCVDFPQPVPPEIIVTSDSRSVAITRSFATLAGSAARAAASLRDAGEPRRARAAARSRALSVALEGGAGGRVSDERDRDAAGGDDAPSELGTGSAAMRAG